MSQTLVRRQFRQAVFVALERSAIGALLDALSDWAVQPEKMPLVRVRAGECDKQQLGRGVPNFTSSVLIEIESYAAGQTAIGAQDAIEALDEKIEIALLTNHDLVSITQKIDLATRTTINAEARQHFSMTQWRIRFECIEEFHPFDAPASMQPVATTLNQVNIHLDLANVVDLSGTYPDAPFPQAISPVPRQSGPDGRNEGCVTIQFEG